MKRNQGGESKNGFDSHYLHTWQIRYVAGCSQRCCHLSNTFRFIEFLVVVPPRRQLAEFSCSPTPTTTVYFMASRACGNSREPCRWTKLQWGRATCKRTLALMHKSSKGLLPRGTCGSTLDALLGRRCLTTGRWHKARHRWAWGGDCLSQTKFSIFSCITALALETLVFKIRWQYFY